MIFAESGPAAGVASADLSGRRSITSGWHLAASDDKGGIMAKDDLPRLRAAPLRRPLHIVLVDPEIPQNTGNIGRLSAAVQCPLHLVGKLGFSLDEKAVRRAGLDYWPLVSLNVHPDLDHFECAHPSTAWKLFSSVGRRSYLDASFQPGDALLFGCESVGLPREILDRHGDQVFALPTIGQVRSLNLSNAVSIVVYEALRQLGAFASLFFDDQSIGAGRSEGTTS